MKAGTAPSFERNLVPIDQSELVEGLDCSLEATHVEGILFFRCRVFSCKLSGSVAHLQHHDSVSRQRLTGVPGDSVACDLELVRRKAVRLNHERVLLPLFVAHRVIETARPFSVCRLPLENL